MMIGEQGFGIESLELHGCFKDLGFRTIVGIRKPDHYPPIYGIPCHYFIIILHILNIINTLLSSSFCRKNIYS